MHTIIVLFNLKAGVSAEAYESWARSTDLVIVNALPSVDRFEILRTTGLLGGGTAPFQYIEILRVPAMDALFADIDTVTMQRVAAEFRAFADAPLFITTTAI